MASSACTSTIRSDFILLITEDILSVPFEKFFFVNIVLNPFCSTLFLISMLSVQTIISLISLQNFSRFKVCKIIGIFFIR